MTEKLSSPPREFDWSILLLAVFLTAVGVVMVYSSSAEMADTLERYQKDDFYFLKRQALFAVIGCGVMAGMMHYDYKKLRKVAGVGLLVCMFLLLAVYIPGLGVKINGAQRWLRLGFNLQPVELAKIALIIYMAHSLAKKQKKVREFVRGILPYAIVLGIILTLLMFQPDLGSPMPLIAIAIAMLFVDSIR
ncbi:MAG: hypothetical protein EHM37_12025 [Deltaproteobacteria bacterium]|nr:MAG: hypothetical protein EHM37_12025 [Deltaproteobacteria bacterium]